MLGFAILAHFGECCYEAVPVVGFLYEEAGIQVFHLKVDRVWSNKDSGLFVLVKVFLLGSQLTTVIERESALPLGWLNRSHVD